MSTNTPIRKHQTTTRVTPTLPKQRTYTPVPSRNHGKVTFAIVSVLAAGVGVAALWMGVGSGSETQAPPLVPSSVQQNTDTSATAFEHRMQQDARAGQSSTNAFEQGAGPGLTAQEWDSALDGLNGRAQSQAQPGQRNESPNINRPGIAGQSSANAVESQLPTSRELTPQERIDLYHFGR